ncbi:MAG TPA: hypothetical protein HA261_14220 [Methanosarcina sp.]|nr:hypothetical protein [Methanosarcina sp.]
MPKSRFWWGSDTLADVKAIFTGQMSFGCTSADTLAPPLYKTSGCIRKSPQKGKDWFCLY